ncbi:hemolysin family protein [Dongia sp.]|uniref:hemolysin family protein n=1 Tax=Dongia sp. TaxID=1977262 RepID=UPI0035B13D40
MTDVPLEDSSVLFEIFIVLGLILLNGFFAMSELAIVSARRARLKPLADGGHRGARKALQLAEDPTQFLSTVQIGITLVGIVAGAYSGATLSAPLANVLDGWPWLAGYAYPVAVTLVVATITYLSLIVGELVPKRIAMNHAEAIAIRVSLVMAFIARVGAPLVFVLRVSTNALLTLIGLGGDRDQAVTEEEVKSMVAEGAESGVFAEEERHMIDRVLHLADYSIRSIMTPRPDIDWVDLNDPLESIIQQIGESSHTRLLLCQASVDEVIGVVHTKDLLHQLTSGQAADVKALDLQACAKPALTLHETTTILRLLELFRGSPSHMAVVLDEYGSVEGIVTQSDIFTVIAGEMGDTQDMDDTIAERDNGSWLIDGRTRLIDVERRLDASGFVHGDYATIAGLVLHRLGRVPKIGESITFNGFRIEVIDLDGRRIDKVLVERLDEAN